MVVTSLRDYAKQKNISYEAVRKQVARYKDELGGHIILDGRQQFLDEEAVAFLDAKRQKNPVAIIQQSKDEAIEELRKEREQLLHKIAAQADEISKLAQWKADNALAIAEANQTKLLLDNTKAQLEQAQKELIQKDGMIAQTVSEASQKAAEEARKVADEEKAMEIAEIQQKAQEAVEEIQKAAADKDKKIQEMENRSRWQRFLDVFK